MVNMTMQTCWQTCWRVLMTPKCGFCPQQVGCSLDSQDGMKFAHDDPPMTWNKSNTKLREKTPLLASVAWLSTQQSAFLPQLISHFACSQLVRLCCTQTNFLHNVVDLMSTGCCKKDTPGPNVKTCIQEMFQDVEETKKNCVSNVKRSFCCEMIEAAIGRIKRQCSVMTGF